MSRRTRKSVVIVVVVISYYYYVGPDFLVFFFNLKKSLLASYNCMPNNCLNIEPELIFEQMFDFRD